LDKAVGDLGRRISVFLVMEEDSDVSKTSRFRVDDITSLFCLCFLEFGICPVGSALIITTGCSTSSFWGSMLVVDSIAFNGRFCVLMRC
jgi:hypothetical protein